MRPFLIPSLLMIALSLLCIGRSVRSAPDPAVEVTLDFGRYGMQLDAPDGASVCQFHGSDPEKGTISAARSYGTLAGFPDDSPSTEFGRFCDVAFSTRGPQGMGLSQVWSTPCGFQTPPGAVGDHCTADAWPKLDFRPYLSDLLPADLYISKDGRPVRGHTVPMLLAALKRARNENQRILFWTDLHTDYPLWMWKDKLRKNPIPEEYWEEAALHIVYFVKYLVARHGVPIHAVSFQNEPDLPSRHGFTPEMLVKTSKVLRERLDEAGLYGVRIIPFTSVVLGKEARPPWMKKTIDTLERTVELLGGPYRDFQPYIDYLGGHMSHGETPFHPSLRNVRFWRASGDFDNHWKDEASVSFNMGPDDQIDEVIRLNTWLYGQGVSLAGIWQVALRMGHTVDNFVLPAQFDIEKDYRHQAIDGAATVYPYVRPGMFLAAGSLGRGARESYSVDGFGGRGKREAVVITNSQEPRSFRVRWRNAARLSSVDVYQATASTRKALLGRRAAEKGEIVIGVPADSVTTLVATAASTRPMAVLVVKDAERLGAQDREIAQQLSKSFDVSVVSQELKDAEQDRFATKRHPVDAMGAACFLLSGSIDRQATAYTYRTVMAPVIAIGELNRTALGVSTGGPIRAGEPLAFRDRLDPPAEMLEGGRPKACGPRLHWEYQQGFERLRRMIELLIG